MRELLVAFLLILLTATSVAKSKPQSNLSPTCEAPANPGRGITPPRVISAPGPDYPKGTNDSRPEAVVLEVIVGSNGRACDPQVKQSPGPEFERAALDAIRGWKWKPATRDGANGISYYRSDDFQANQIVLFYNIVEMSHDYNQ
jgi:TonB family protein